MKTTIGGKSFELHENPKHRAVKNARNYLRDWALQTLDLEKLDTGKEIDEAIREMIRKDSSKAVDVINMEEEMNTDQTIMLATNKSLKQIEKLKDQLSYQEFNELFEKCKEAIGSDAAGFFSLLGIGSSSIQTTAAETTTEETEDEGLESAT